MFTGKKIIQEYSNGNKLSTIYNVLDLFTTTLLQTWKQYVYFSIYLKVYQRT